MSSIFISPALHFAGPAVRRCRPHQFATVRRCLSHHTSLRRSPLQSAILPRGCGPASSIVWGRNVGVPFYTNIEVLSCNLMNKRNYSWSPHIPYLEHSKSPNRFFRDESVIQNLLSVDPFFLAGVSVSPHTRCMSTHQRVRDRKALSRKEGQNCVKKVRNTRESSERAEGRSVDKNTSENNKYGAAAPVHRNKDSSNNNRTAVSENTEEEDKKLTLYQRFKKTYKEHGKVLVAVHIATSVVWFGTFYTAASLGFDIVPLLESWNLSERVISPFRSGGLGNVALAYLLYKLATPARYTVTIAGTRYAIGYLQKEGRMKVVPKEDSLRSLYKEGKEDIKGRSRKRISSMRRKARRFQKKNGDQSR